MELLALLAAVLGVVAAIINRKRILVLRYEQASSPVTVGKRFKRFLLCVGLAFLFPVLYGVVAGVSATEQATDKAVTDVLVWSTGICLLLGAYQFVAMIVLIFARLWR
jgi:hypothetical protein